MTAAIMMVSYNRLELTRKTLENLFETTDYPFYLIIVDNGSTDGTLEYFNSFLEKRPTANPHLQQIIIKTNPTNRGVAIGRNLGLVEADKLTDVEWLCTVDNDVLLPAGWLSEAIDILSQNPGYASIGVNFEGVDYPLITINGKTFQHKARGNLGTACMVFHKSIHKLLGFFNYKEYSNLYGLEDSDWGARLVLGAKLKIGYIQAPGVHLGEDSGEDSEYRRMKTAEHDKYKTLFQKNCALYYQGMKGIYVPFKE